MDQNSKRLVTKRLSTIFSKQKEPSLISLVPKSFLTNLSASFVYYLYNISYKPNPSLLSCLASLTASYTLSPLQISTLHPIHSLHSRQIIFGKLKPRVRWRFLAQGTDWLRISLINMKNTTNAKRGRLIQQEKNIEFGVRLPMLKLQVFYLLCDFENYLIIWSVIFRTCITGTIKLSSPPSSQVGCDD